MSYATQPLEISSLHSLIKSEPLIGNLNSIYKFIELFTF